MFTYPITGSGAGGAGDIVAHWAFEEGNNTDPRADSHVGGYDLAVSAVVQSGPGKIGNCLLTTSAAVFVSNDSTDLSLAGSDFSVSGWMNSKSFADDHYFCGRGNYAVAGATGREWCIYSLNASDKFSFSVGNGTTAESVTWTTNFDYDTFHFVVAVCDVTNSLLKLSIDGAAFVTTPLTITPQQSTVGLNVANPADAGLGYMRGEIDELTLYNRALTTDDIAALYNGGTGVTYEAVDTYFSENGSGLFNSVDFWLPLDEASGNRADSHTGAVFTDYNTVGSTTGVLGTAADFVDTNLEYLENAASYFEYSDPWTFTGWTKFGKSGAADRNTAFWAGTGVDAPTIVIDTLSTDLRLYINTTTFEGGNATTFSTGSWYHWAAVHDPATGTNGTVYFYVNNVLELTITLANPISSSIAFPVYLRVGKSGNSAPRHLLGQAEAYAAFDAALTVDQIGWLYNSGTPRAYTEL